MGQWGVRLLDYCHYSVTALLHHSMQKVIVAPSILAADFSRLADEVPVGEIAVPPFGSVHLDVAELLD